MNRHSHIVWEQVDRTHESDIFDKIAELDTLCFNHEEGFERLTADSTIYGDIYALKINGSVGGYAIYGQVWLLEQTEAYISRIGVYPHHRHQGYGLKILEAILSDLSRYPSRMLPLFTETSGKATSLLNASLEKLASTFIANMMDFTLTKSQSVL